MECRIENLEERLRAMSGALRLRGEWHQPTRMEPADASGSERTQVLRLRDQGSAGAEE